jgi:alpha-L-fucosidase
LGKKAGLCETEIKDIEMIGSSEQIKWEINDEFLRINLPKEKPCDYAMIFKLTM